MIKLRPTKAKPLSGNNAISLTKLAGFNAARLEITLASISGLSQEKKDGPDDSYQK
jgi:hypothetical protein